MGRDFRRLSILAAALIAAPSLAASGFQLREQNPAAQGNSFAGATAGYGGLGSSFFNPAVLAPIDGVQFLAGLSSVAPKAELRDAVGTRALSVPGPLRPISGPGSYGDAARDAVLPNLYAVWAVGPDVRLALSVNAPFGLVTDYPAHFVGRYHALKSDLKTMDLAFSASYRASEQWAFGATVLHRKATAEITSAMDFGLIASKFGTLPGTLDGIASLKGSASALGYKAGVLFTPTRALRLGLAYQAAMNMDLKGDAGFQLPSALPAPLAAGLQAQGFRTASGAAELNLPSCLSAGLDWQMSPALSLQGEAARTGWSSFRELRARFTTGLPDSVTEEYWKDAWFYSAGLTWKVDTAWTFRTGVAFDQSAVDPDFRTPRIPDSDRTWVSVGASWAYSPAVTFDFGYSHIVVKDAALNLSAGTSSTAPNFARGSLRGTYRSGIEVVAIGARFTF